MQLTGIHHLTAVTADAPGNNRFYTQVMGMRRVKKTVNQDDPSVYHLFYGDELARPGGDAPRGEVGQVLQETVEGRGDRAGRDERGDDGAAQGASRRAARLVGQQADGPAPPGGADEVAHVVAAPPRPHEEGPPPGEPGGEEGVGERGEPERRVGVVVVGDETGVEEQTEHGRGAAVVELEGAGRAPQVTHAEVARAQHPRRLGVPRPQQLLDDGDEVGRGEAAGGVDIGDEGQGAVGVRCSDVRGRGGAVGEVPPQGQTVLAGQDDGGAPRAAVGREDARGDERLDGRRGRAAGVGPVRDRRAGGQTCGDGPTRGGRRSDRRLEVRRRENRHAEGGGGRAELTGVGTEQRLDAPDDLVPVGGAPQQRPQPQPGQTGIEVVPRPRGQQRGEDRGVDRRPADEDRCGEEVEIGAGQVVERPGQARRRRRAGRCRW